MDFKNWKKIKDDSNQAVFKHQNGSELIITKKGLSKKHIDQMNKLPIHAAYGNEGDPGTEETKRIQAQDAEIDARDAAEKAKADENKSANQPRYLVNNQPGTDARPAPQAPVTINIQGQQPPSPVSPQAPEPANTGQAPAGLAPDSLGEEVFNQPPQSAPKRPPAAIVPPESSTPQSSMPQPKASAPVSNYQAAYDNYQASHQEEFGRQAAAYEHDLVNGHITPKTYSEMFADKSTIGKIGTLFGLLLSGAGSGITGQPNAVLQMMNKEIENDLKAQEDSKINAQNFLRIHQQGELNKAQIKRFSKENALSDAQVQNTTMDTKIKARTVAKTDMLLSSLDSMQGITNKLPPAQQGPASQLLNGVKQAAYNEIQQNNARAATALANKNVGTEADYLAKIENLRRMELLGQEGAGHLAETREKHYLPSIGVTDKAASDKLSDNITKLKNFQNLLQEADDLNKKIGAVRGRVNALSPSERLRADRIHGELKSGYTDVKGLNRLTDTDLKLYDKMVPNFNVMNLTGAQTDLLNDVRKSVGNKVKLEYKMGGVHPFSGGEEDPSQAQDTVRVIHPTSGKTGSIPRDQLKEALANGFKEKK